MIRIGVTSAVKAEGINHLKDKGTLFTCLDVARAMADEWAEDAHFVGYAPIDDKGNDFASLTAEVRWHRINKPCLPHIRQVGGDVLLNMFVFDYDLNMNVDEQVLYDHGWDGSRRSRPKISWTPSLLEDWGVRLNETRAAFAKRGVAWANFIYTTTNGARYVHLLAEGRPADEAEAYLSGLMEIYRVCGAVMDPACRDWTRLFRLPKVMRDGRPTWESPFFRSISQMEEFLVLDGIDPVTSRTAAEYGEIKELDIPLPKPEKVMGLLETVSKNNRITQTPAHKKAKKLLKGHDCFPPLFESAPLAPEGNRDSTLMRLAGQVCSYLHASNVYEGQELFTPEHVYALFLPAVQDLEPDAGTPSWEHSAWSKILRCWARETAKAEVTKKQDEETAENVTTKVDSMLEGVQRWAPSISTMSRSTAIETLSRMLIAGTPSGHFYVMQPDGYYRAQPVRQSHLRAMIREMGLNDIIPPHKFENGRLVKLSPDDIMSDHGTIVTSIQGRVAIEGTIIEDLGTADAKLVVPLFRRRDLVPQFDERVDQWLRLLVDTDFEFKRLCKWLAYSLDFEGGPICALSLSGPPSVGKKLLARGLAETVNTACAASGFDLIQTHNTTMGRTPWLVVDEGLPARVPGGLDIADRFRQIVSGETITINPKYQTCIMVNNPMRVLFTSNNHDVVRQLTKHRDLSPDDQRAIGIRILHFDAQTAAAAYLACPDSNNPDFGGLAFTRGWIAGDAGQASDYVVARHLLHLYECRADFGPPESRLLVEGNANSDVIQEMATSSGIAPDIIETIVSMIEDVRGNFDGVSICDSGRIYVTASAVLNYYRNDLVLSRRLLDTHKVSGVLKSLTVNVAGNATSKKTLAGTVRRYRWWELDIMRIFKLAVEAGMKHTKLEELMRRRFGDKATDALAGGLPISEAVKAVIFR